MDSTSYAPKVNTPQLIPSGYPVWRENSGQERENDTEGAYRAGNRDPVNPGGPVSQSVIGIGGNPALQGQTLLQASNGRSEANVLAAPIQEEAPVTVSWKDPTVHKLELPFRTLKSTPSEVTDLGDRAFYADLNAKCQASADVFMLERRGECSTLEDILREAIVNSFEEGKSFSPRALLSTLVSQERVFRELSDILKQTRPKFSFRLATGSPLRPIIISPRIA